MFQLAQCVVRPVQNRCPTQVQTQIVVSKIDVRCESQGEHFWVLAHRSLMTRALINLLSNAVKFSSPATRVDCIVSATSDTVVCVVRNQGYGIAIE